MVDSEIVLTFVPMKQIISNLNETFTVKFEGWSVTANATELEEIYQKCYGKSILTYLKKAQNGI